MYEAGAAGGAGLRLNRRGPLRVNLGGIVRLERGRLVLSEDVVVLRLAVGLPELLGLLCVGIGVWIPRVSKTIVDRKIARSRNKWPILLVFVRKLLTRRLSSA